MPLTAIFIRSTIRDFFLKTAKVDIPVSMHKVILSGESSIHCSIVDSGLMMSANMTSCCFEDGLKQFTFLRVLIKRLHSLERDLLLKLTPLRFSKGLVDYIVFLFYLKKAPEHYIFLSSPFHVLRCLCWSQRLIGSFCTRIAFSSTIFTAYLDVLNGNSLSLGKMEAAGEHNRRSC